jgi:hypothetical protein
MDIKNFKKKLFGYLDNFISAILVFFFLIMASSMIYIGLKMISKG